MAHRYDSPVVDLFEDADSPLFYRGAGKNCELLFDELFPNDVGRNSDSLVVKRPAVTYGRKRLQRPAQPHLMTINLSDDDDDEENDESDAEFNTDKDSVIIKVKKKKYKYPECTKDALLDAFNKAIEANDLPDFEKFEKQELSIVIDEKENLEEPNSSKSVLKNTNQNTKKSKAKQSKQIKLPSKKKSRKKEVVNDENAFVDNQRNVGMKVKTPLIKEITTPKRCTALKPLNSGPVTSTPLLSHHLPALSNNIDPLPRLTTSIIISSEDSFRAEKSFLTRSASDYQTRQDLTLKEVKAKLTSVLSRKTNKEDSLLNQLVNQCTPSKVLIFDDYINSHAVPISKIGEGSFAEVYLIGKISRGDSCRVFKIIPLDTDDDTMLMSSLVEISILQAFSNLNRDKLASNFICLNQAVIVKGRFPEKLCSEWDKFNKRQVSQNEDPRQYGAEKHYLCLEMSYGGIELEKFTFKTSLEALSVLLQIAVSLAIAEDAVEFEHRDLHVSNIVVKTMSQQTCHYSLRGSAISFNTIGVHPSIIDFTLSRLSQDKMILYQDLVDSDIFDQQGDYQFEVYRMMRELNQNRWSSFHAKTNIYWLHYLTDKMIHKKYSSRAKKHETGMKWLRELHQSLMSFDSAINFVTSSSFEQFKSVLV